MEEFTEFSALHLWGCEFFVQLIPDRTGTSFPHLSEHSKDTMKCEMLEHPRDSADIHLSEGHLRSRLFPICIWGQAPQGHPNQPLPLHVPGMTADPGREVLWGRPCLLRGQEGSQSGSQGEKTTGVLCLL